MATIDEKSEKFIDLRPNPISLPSKSGSIVASNNSDINIVATNDDNNNCNVDSNEMNSNPLSISYASNKEFTVADVKILQIFLLVLVNITFIYYIISYIIILNDFLNDQDVSFFYQYYAGNYV